jgi:hypothetical protein
VPAVSGSSRRMTPPIVDADRGHGDVEPAVRTERQVDREEHACRDLLEAVGSGLAHHPAREGLERWLLHTRRIAGRHLGRVERAVRAPRHAARVGQPARDDRGRSSRRAGGGRGILSRSHEGRTGCQDEGENEPRREESTAGQGNLRPLGVTANDRS